MNSWAKHLDRLLKGHDSMLFLQETKLGRFDVYRKSEFGGQMPHLIFSLTEDWTVKSRPIEYGIEVVLSRIKAHDMWRDDTFIERWLAGREKVAESKERDRKNNVESFLYDFAGQFQKATEEINTGTLKKLYRKEGYTNAYCESGS